MNICTYANIHVHTCTYTHTHMYVCMWTCVLERPQNHAASFRDPACHTEAAEAKGARSLEVESGEAPSRQPEDTKMPGRRSCIGNLSPDLRESMYVYLQVERIRYVNEL